MKFLQSIELTSLRDCWCATLTVGRDIPTYAKWALIRRRFLHALRRRQPYAYYWMMEFQTRGAPHLHVWVNCSGFGGSDTKIIDIVAHWLKLTEETGAKSRGQHFAPVDPRVAWARYLAKHMSRGFAHYQRDAIPSGWKVSGRVWGQGGDWPTKSTEGLLNDRAFFIYRRALRNYTRSFSGHRAKKLPKDQSGFMAKNCWIPEKTSLRLFAWACDAAGLRGETVGYDPTTGEVRQGLCTP